MTTPKIELKSIKVHVGLSDETPAYTAKIFVDGEHFADVSNQGHGGGDHLCPIRSKVVGFCERVEELEQVIAAVYPKTDMVEHGGEGFLDESLECICHGLVWLHVDQRNFKSKLSRKVLICKDGKVYDLKGKKSVDLLKAAVDKFGAENILNTMSFNDAWDVFVAV